MKFGLIVTALAIGFSMAFFTTEQSVPEKSKSVEGTYVALVAPVYNWVTCGQCHTPAQMAYLLDEAYNGNIIPPCYIDPPPPPRPICFGWGEMPTDCYTCHGYLGIPDEPGYGGW